MKDLINNSLKQHSKVLEFINESDIINSASLILAAIIEGGTIFWCGNGGSASQANHLSESVPFRSFKTSIRWQTLWLGNKNPWLY